MYYEDLFHKMLWFDAFYFKGNIGRPGPPGPRGPQGEGIQGPKVNVTITLNIRDVANTFDTRHL